MRAFFALKPSPEICLAIDHWRSQNWPLLNKPVPIVNFHLTLAFLGEIDERQLEYLEDAVADVYSGCVELNLDTLGYWHKSALLWLGPTQTPPELADLAGQLVQLGKSCGQKMDKRAYHSHLTLARKVTSPPPAAMIEPAFTCLFEEFALYESDTRPTGAQYREVVSWPLIASPVGH